MNVVDIHGSIIGYSGPMIHTGHCIEWLASLEAKSVGVVLTDPPYDVHVHGKARRAKDVKPAFPSRGRRTTKLGFDSLSLDEMDAAAYQFARVAQRWVIAFCSIEMVNDWRLALVRHEDDTTPKPVPLMVDLVDDFTHPGELVIDPFAGMGTTGEACILRGRRFLGCELKPKKAARANERLLAVAEDSNIQAREAGQLTLMGAGR